MTLCLSFNCSYAMKENEDSAFNEIEVKTLRKPLLNLNQLNDIEEEKSNSSNYNCSPFSFLHIIGLCWDNIRGWQELCLVNSAKSKNEQINLQMLPNEILLTVASFLSSVDILRLSGTCRKFRQLFDGRYWVTYLSQKPQAYSCLLLDKTLSPSLQRKEFFSHLWYAENRISLAARLNHPEAIALRKYGSYGVYIDKDQYLCPSGAIRYVSGKIDEEKTKCLRDAQRKKIDEDLRRNEELRRRAEQQRNRFGGWKKGIY